MAGLGAKLFTAFSKLTAAQVNGYLMDQSIMRFASAAVRDAAFGGVGEPTLAEGMFCYLDDTNQLQSYNGSAWVGVAASSTVANVSSGLVYVASGTFTNINTSTALSLSLSADYPHYKLIMSWTQSVAAGYLNMQLRNNVGAIITTSTYDNQRIDQYSTSIIAGGALGNASWKDLAYNYNLGFQSAFSADIMYATVAQPTIMHSRGTTKRTGGGGSYIYAQENHSMQNDNMAMTGLVIFPDIGNSTGSYSLYGYR